MKNVGQWVAKKLTIFGFTQLCKIRVAYVSLQNHTKIHATYVRNIEAFQASDHFEINGKCSCMNEEIVKNIAARAF